MLQIDKKDLGSRLITTSDQIVKSPNAASASAALWHFDEDVVNKKAAENVNQTVCDPMKQTNNKIASISFQHLYPDSLLNVKLNAEQFLDSVSCAWNDPTHEMTEIF